MISNICLHNFRNYVDTCINFEKSTVVLFGKNGSGKTNLLEAISLFSVGCGMRSCALSEMIYAPSQNENSCSPENSERSERKVTAGLCGAKISIDEQFNLETEIKFTESGGVRRGCKIQGCNVRSAINFHEYLNIVSIVPTMDHLFVSSSSSRRSFIDNLISSYFPYHKSNVQDYEKAAKQRLSLLKHEERPDPSWISSLELIMAEKSFSISKARKDFTEILDAGQNDYIPLFPRFKSFIVGSAEGVEKEEISKTLQQNREKDKLCSMTTFGCHRSDWVVTHSKNNRPVKDCSTGEQKIILISVILSFVDQKLKKNDRILLSLLLDDVVARLDFVHRCALFEQVRDNEIRFGNNQVQVFFSGTELDSFTHAQSCNDAQFFLFESGGIVQHFDAKRI